MYKMYIGNFNSMVSNCRYGYFLFDDANLGNNIVEK